MKKTLKLTLPLLLLALSWLQPARAEAAGQAVWLGVGGQIGFRTYGSYLRLGGGYLHQLNDKLWLDLGVALLARKHSDIVLNGGVRWKLGKGASGWSPYFRAGGEIAILARASATKVVIAGHGGVGAGYFAGGGTGLVLEAGLSLGPAFGDGGADFAISCDIMLAVEFPF